MIDLSGLLSDASSVGNLILVNPKINIGIRAKTKVKTGSAATYFTNLLGLTPPETFLFHVPTEDSVTLTSDVTDHFVENNTAIADHVALKPESVTAAGYIGELNNVPPALLEPLKFAADKLTTLSPYAPALSASAIIAFNTASQAYAAVSSVANTAVNTTLAFAGASDLIQNKQQKAFTKFHKFWLDRQLFTVQTPWEIFDNMIIMSLKATQAEDTRMVTDFEITFKQMRFAESIIIKPKPTKTGRAGSASAARVNKGISKPTFAQTAKAALARFT